MQMGSPAVSILVDLDPASTDGKVREVAKNGSQGPLEFPSAIVFVGNTVYISKNDTPRRRNLDASGTAARDGIGASIAQITP
jgi:hypothetical protein